MNIEYNGKVVFLSQDEINYLDSKQQIVHYNSGKMKYNNMEVYRTENSGLSVKNNFLGE